MATDSNSTSTTWHDVTRNVRRRLLEKFIASNQLQIINEVSGSTIYHSRTGQSNIDINITNIKMLTAIDNWEISEEESASDHNIIKFHIILEKDEDIFTCPHGYMHI